MGELIQLLALIQNVLQALSTLRQQRLLALVQKRLHARFDTVAADNGRQAETHPQVLLIVADGHDVTSGVMLAF